MIVKGPFQRKLFYDSAALNIQPQCRCCANSTERSSTILTKVKAARRMLRDPTLAKSEGAIQVCKVISRGAMTETSTARRT